MGVKEFRVFWLRAPLLEMVQGAKIDRLLCFSTMVTSGSINKRNTEQAAEL